MSRRVLGEIGRVLGAWLLGLACLPVWGCNTPHGDMKSLLRDVDSYHRDLLFERYEVAANRIVPSERASWLTSMKSLGLRFAEIEVVGTEPCSEYSEECMIIHSQMQWYSGHSPTVNTGTVVTTWQFDKESKSWQIVEMSQQ